MSTHRVIEWFLFILGLLGLSLSILSNGLPQILLFALATLFAGLHVFHLYDGHKANHVVVASSLTLAVYLGYVALTNAGNVSGGFALWGSVTIAILLSLLSLRLRRDFHRK